VTTYQVMPPLTADEYADLRADIAANGVRVPIDVTEDGEILDGHHRFEIAQELNVYCPTRVIAGLSEDEKVAHAYSVNLARRQLSREAKRALVAASLARDPGLSDRQHAERTGVSPTTAGAVRGEMEDSGQLSKLDSRTSADGRQRPAQQPTRPAEWTCDECGSAFKTEHTHCATCRDHYPAPEVCTAHHDIVNTETGEIVRRSPTRKLRGPLYNRMTLAYQRDGLSGMFRARRILDGLAQERVLPTMQGYNPPPPDDVRTVGSPFVAESQSRFGILDRPPIETPHLWSHASASRLLEFYAARDALPLDGITYDGEQLDRILPGDVAVLNDPGAGVSERLAIVDDVIVGGPTVQIDTVLLPQLRRA